MILPAFKLPVVTCGSPDDSCSVSCALSPSLAPSCTLSPAPAHLHLVNLTWPYLRTLQSGAAGESISTSVWYIAHLF